MKKFGGWYTILGTFFSLMAVHFTSNPIVLAEKETDYVPNEVLVQWESGLASGDTVADSISVIPVSDVEDALQVLGDDSRVAHIEPNYRRYLAVAPDDEYYTSELHLEQSNDHDIDAELAWDMSTGDRTVIVAVIDSGTDIDHPDLVDNIWTNPNEIAGNNIDDDGNGYVDDIHGWDMIEDDNDPSPVPTGDSFNDTYVLHGTHVAGIIGATGNNALGVTGVNWKVSIMPIRIFDDDGLSTTSAVIDAIAYAQVNGAKVMNMSYGGYFYSELEDEAMADAYADGVLSVAAAGNDTIDLDEIPSYPICYDNVIGVGAVDANDDTTSFTNYGNSCLDLAAPGLSILSTYYTNDSNNGFTDDYGYLSGTSMATPIVSGLAALLLSADANLTPDAIAKALIETTDPISDTELGSGRVNAATALDYVINPLPGAVTITAYTNSDKKQKIVTEQRTRETTPYFNWAEPSSIQAVDGYYVYFGTDKGDPVTDGTLQTERSFAPAELTGNEIEYRLRVKTLDDIGQTSDLAQFVYVVDTKMNRPIVHTVKRVKKTIVVRWHRPKAEHAAGYYVYRSRHKTGPFKKVTTRLLTKRSYTDTTIDRDKRYYYKVRAVDDLGNTSTLSAAKRSKK